MRKTDQAHHLVPAGGPPPPPLNLSTRGAVTVGIPQSRPVGIQVMGMGRDGGEGRDGRVPVVDVTVVGVDVGVRRSVVAFVGTWAKLLSDLAVVYARQNGVSLIPLGVYDAMTRAYVAEISYPGLISTVVVS